MSDDPTDEEMRRFLDALPPHLTFSERAAELRKRFGARAWSIDAIERDWHRRGNGRKWCPSKIERNGPLAAFIRDRVGTRTLDGLIAEIEAVFGAGATSRAALHRFWTKVRAQGRPGKAR